MKKLIVATLCAAFAALLAAPGVKAGVQDFSITSFTGDYYLSRDEGRVSELRVVEKIVAQFPDYDQNHGIERALPETYKDHPLELRVARVADAGGNALPYETYTSNGNLVLRIGDAKKYVYGETTYVVEYTMRGVINHQDSHDEFYWDINGDQWRQQFGRVEARVHVPAGLAGSLSDDNACYAGSFGSLQTNCTVNPQKDADGTTVTFGTLGQKPLAPGETLSVVLGFNKGTFAGYSVSAWQMWEWIKLAASLVVPPLLAFVFIIRQWYKKGRDPKGKTAIVPNYVPPKDVSVLGSGSVLHEGFNAKAVSATIIDLAVRHYIKIYETKAEKLFQPASYELELIKSPANLRAEEKSVVSMLFHNQAAGARVKLDDLKAKLAMESQALGKSVDAAMAKQGYFTLAPDKARAPYFVAGGLLFAVGFAPIMMGLYALGGGIMAAGLVMLIGAIFMPARTMRGVELRNYLYGVRDYIKLAEAERLKMLQSPRGELTEKIDIGDNKQLIKLYEKLLPYAMLFGLEKEWAQEMAGLYQQAPDWYAGSTAFNAAWLAGSLGGFGAHTQSVFAPPGSSSGSGFGGGAGGGGGGGGGGGW